MNKSALHLMLALAAAAACPAAVTPTVKPPKAIVMITLTTSAMET